MKTYYSSDVVFRFRKQIILIAMSILLPLFSALAQQVPVDLGTAANFAVLAGPAISSTQGGTINGDVGVSPGNTFTPGTPAVTINGVLHLADGVSLQGQNDLVTAYNDAAGRTVPTLVAGGELGGLVLAPGLYKDDGAPESLGLTGTLTLDGQGDPNAVWIFQSGSTLIAEVNSRVVLTNGAQACNVFWQVTSSATLRTGTIFKGNILALSAITLENLAVLDGRALARNAAVTLDNNTVSIPICFSPSVEIAKSMTNEFFYAGTATPRLPMVGDTLNFVITISNTGDVDLVTVPVSDSYDVTQLQYVDATPASDDNENDGLINWSNVGPLAPGASTSIVANFVMLCVTNVSFVTNSAVATPTTASNMPPALARTVVTPVEVGNGILGDTVWNDLNGNGLPDEDLTLNGLDGVTVRLYSVVNTATNFLSQTVTATVDGQRGFYQFFGLAGGTNRYWVRVDSTTVPLTLPVNTTPLGRLVQLTSCGSFYDADFGFISGVVSNASDFAISKTLTNLYYYAGTTNPRAPQIGEQLNFVITIVNTGAVDLVTVPVLDVYDTGLLEYVNASPASDDNVNDGLINWTNVGPLAQGVSTSIVVNFIAVCMSTNAPFGTNTVIASPTTAPNGPQVAPGLAFAAYELAHGLLGDTVWIDVNGNGLPDEDLAVYGLNGAAVRLYEIVGSSTNFLSQTVTATVDGQRGHYQFTGLSYGTNVYWVRVVQASIPATLPVNTTPLSLTAQLTECGSFYDANFGFMSDSPTVVDLVEFRAVARGDSVQLSWKTLMERENAGFNLYRALEPDGVRTKINAALIPGAGDGTGRFYAFDDPGTLANGTYYYWIEDVEIDGVATVHDPVRVTIGLDILKSVAIGSAALGKAGLYMITADTFRRSGIQPASVDPTRLSVYVDGTEVAAYVSTELPMLADEDYLLFYSPAGKQVSIGYAQGDVVRMPFRFVFPEYGEGDVWVGGVDSESNDVLVTSSRQYVRYLITGFQEDTVWLLDVTDAVLPSLLLGAELIQIDDEIGVYFSETADGSIYAASDSAVTEIETITP